VRNEHRVRLFRPSAVAAIAATAPSHSDRRGLRHTPREPSNNRAERRFTKEWAAETFWVQHRQATVGGRAHERNQHHHQTGTRIPADYIDAHPGFEWPVTVRRPCMEQRAQFALVNGVCYDPWAPQVWPANPNRTATVPDRRPQHLVGSGSVWQPHRW